MSAAPPAARAEPVDRVVAGYEVVVVTYHSRAQLTGLIEHARPTGPVVVVDNASGADGVPEVVDELPTGRWLDGGNSGFARAANLGARTCSAEFVVFANPDSRPTEAIWAAMVDQLRADPRLVAVGAATTGPDGDIELGVGGWEPTPLRAWVHALGLHHRWPTAGVFAKPAIGQSVQLEWISGACLAVRREAFVELGGFDERYFVYNEDMAFGRAVRRAGGRLLLRTDLLVPHATASSGGAGTAMPQQRGASMAGYLHDHHGPASARVMRAAFAVGMLPRIAVAAARGDRSRVRQHWAYVRGIATQRSPYRAGSR
jgi:N-acetylglucosaminyl-diphospho-decaprenol L-rhamnosyltransferase